jgi:hypothetical protein
MNLNSVSSFIFVISWFSIEWNQYVEVVGPARFPSDFNGINLFPTTVSNNISKMVYVIDDMKDGISSRDNMAIKWNLTNDWRHRNEKQKMKMNERKH